jgi:hypothetical protein
MTLNPDAGLAELMEELQSALRKGQFDGLADLTSAIEAALPQARLAGPEELRRIQRLAERNASSLLAARGGVKAARRRISEVLSAARGLVTYDRSGHRIEENQDRTLARRF